MSLRESVWKGLHRKITKINIVVNGCHTNVVYKIFPMLQAMKILDAKAAVDKEWEKLETIPAWQLDTVKSKEVWKHKETKRKSTLLH